MDRYFVNLNITRFNGDTWTTEKIIEISEFNLKEDAVTKFYDLSNKCKNDLFFKERYGEAVQLSIVLNDEVIEKIKFEYPESDERIFVCFDENTNLEFFKGTICEFREFLADRFEKNEFIEKVLEKISEGSFSFEWLKIKNKHLFKENSSFDYKIV